MVSARTGPAIAAAALALTLAQNPADAVSIAVKSRAMQPGELVVVTVTTARPADRVQVRAFDRDAPAYRVDPETWRALVGIDLDVKPGTYPLTVATGSGAALGRAAQDLVVTPHDFPTRRLTVDDSFVNPPEAVMDRIASEAKDLERLWTESAKERLWSGDFVRPVSEAANSAFGSRSIFNDQPRSPHSGADFLSPAGTPIHAPNGGRIVLARELYFTGNTVIIDHGLGLFSMMAHLSAIDVHEAGTVVTGHVLGEVGATGRVTGAHLHWAIRLNGARVDPLSLLAVLGGSGGGRQVR